MELAATNSATGGGRDAKTDESCDQPREVLRNLVLKARSCARFGHFATQSRTNFAPDLKPLRPPPEAFTELRAPNAWPLRPVLGGARNFAEHTEGLEPRFDPRVAFVCAVSGRGAWPRTHALPRASRDLALWPFWGAFGLPFWLRGRMWSISWCHILLVTSRPPPPS